MSNLSSWKKIAIGAVAIAIAIFGVVYFTKSTGKKDAVTFINPAFGEYVSSYTSGVLGSNSTIRIMLAQDAVDSTQIGQESSVKLFSLSPGVTGKTVWLDPRTVEYRPEGRLTSGQVYTVSFQLSKLVDVPKELEVFEYTFQVIPQNFEVTIDNVKPYIKTELKRQKIEGVLSTSDFAANEAIEGAMTAAQNGKTLKITWSHTGEGKQHPFVVEDVSRGDQPGKVELEIHGEGLGIVQNDTREVEIPALGDFKVMNVKVEQSSNQHVVIQFSDPLNEKQDVNGLITLSDVGSVDFEIKDNEIKVFPPARQTGSKTLSITGGIRNVLDYRMKEGGTYDVVFEQLNPAVRFTGKGSILPSTDGLIMPFEAVNLKSVDVEIVKIFETNVLQFLQVNDLDGSGEIRRVGKPVLRKTVSLENAATDLGKWNRFTLDLSTLINTEPGAIYQVRIGFKKAYSAFACVSEDGDGAPDMATLGGEDWSEAEDTETSYWDSYEEYYYDEGYDWEQRDNPCHVSYYTGNRNIKRNVIASDLGLLAKRGGDGNTLVFVTDLRTAKPTSGVALELYDFQQQLIGRGTTDNEGKAVISSKEAPFALVARNGAQRGYLKLQGGESLSLSNFDVGGEQVNKGLKGLLYGERGVWRPGDSLYLTFILEDKLKLLPATHPVVFELQNPQGQVTSRIVRSTGEHGFYKFAAVTAADAPTGNWTGRVKVGGAEFSQPLKIEMVKPNRLKINFDMGVDKITAGNNNISANLNVKWLHGAPGKNLKAEFEVLLTPAETKFQHYPDYTFEDASREFSSETQQIFEGYTDEEGNATVNASLEAPEEAPGMLNAIFRGKAFEESGNFSIDRFSIPYYPYESFTGIRLPAGDKARGMLLTDTTHRVDIVTVDADGKPVSHDGIEVTLYKLNWRWWWDNTDGNANYISNSITSTISSGTTRTVNGVGSWKFRVNYPEWGRFYVKACDPVSGHCTGKEIYIDWPGWAGRSRGGNEGATMLSFSSDKPAYNIGEKVNIVIPGSDQGQALVSVENGSRVLQSYWVETKKGDNPFSFEVTREMTPNVFLHVTMIQPHAQTVNDLPIRLYGVIPIKIEDPQTHLEPVIEMPDVLEPGQEVSITVSEKSKRKMTYTLAMVDEGLLDLTRFKTPDAWNRFYAREALGVQTWDLYDEVMGAFGSRIERLLALGGDMEAAQSKADDAKANRFKPVVKFLGPFTLDGGSQTHKFTMPQYIGSVKTMVVAGYEGAYGKTDKATPVRKPLMVLATLPRVLGPEEKLKLPVTLFSMEKNIKNVKIEIKASGPLQVNAPSQTVTLSSSDMTVDFDLVVKSATGVGKIEVIATSGNYRASDVIEIEVRNPNPMISKVDESILEAGKTWNMNVTPVGIAGTNTAVLEISNLPPINLGQRMKYLLMYPYGCVEQTTSTVFPQLYLDQVKVLSDVERATIQNNVRAGIERLRQFVTRDGGFSYWPGYEDSDSWGSTYAGHFLIEAEAKGYVVSRDIIKRWKKYQRDKAQNWRKSQEYSSSELIQAYRLYTLAFAGDPELGAMNRLREQPNLPATAGWMLAAAYVKAGQPEAAKKLVATLSTNVKPYQEMAYTYGSDVRDKAIILETLLMLNERTKGFELMKEISAAMSNQGNWMSTQTIAWCLKAVGTFAGTEKRGELKFTYTYKGKDVTASTELPIAQVILPVDGATSGALKVVSESKGSLFARVIKTGIPARGTEEDAESNMSVSVSYTDTDGNAIDPTQLEQGTAFVAAVTVNSLGYRGTYKNLALNQVFPSGWEINNLRLDEAESKLTADKPTYQDIRDDRVYTYFDLGPNQRKTFKVLLTASYAGSYYLPAVSCEAMYDHTIYARKKGQVVEVVKRASIQ